MYFPRHAPKKVHFTLRFNFPYVRTFLFDHMVVTCNGDIMSITVIEFVYYDIITSMTFLVLNNSLLFLMVISGNILKEYFTLNIYTVIYTYVRT